jgi:hypothetical protein
MSKDTYYFPHDFNAGSDEKILYLRSKFGMQAYGLYWLLIEIMHESSDSKLTCNLIDGIAYQINVDITFLKEFYNECISIELFVTDGVKYWSERVLRNKELLYEKRNLKSIAGKKGMENRWKNKEVITNDNIVITEDNKGNESKVKEIKEKEIKVNKRKVVGTTLFVDSDVNTIEKFEESFIGTQYEIANFNYYFEVIKNWSDSKGEKKKDWIATAKNWMARDLTEGKLIDKNYNPNAKRINPNQQLSYAEREAARRNSL